MARSRKARSSRRPRCKTSRKRDLRRTQIHKKSRTRTYRKRHLNRKARKTRQKTRRVQKGQQGGVPIFRKRCTVCHGMKIRPDSESHTFEYGSCPLKEEDPNSVILQFRDYLLENHRVNKGQVNDLLRGIVYNFAGREQDSLGFIGDIFLSITDKALRVEEYQGFPRRVIQSEDEYITTVRFDMATILGIVDEYSRIAGNGVTYELLTVKQLKRKLAQQQQMKGQMQLLQMSQIPSSRPTLDDAGFAPVDLGDFGDFDVAQPDTTIIIRKLLEDGHLTQSGSNYQLTNERIQGYGPDRDFFIGLAHRPNSMVIPQMITLKRGVDLMGDRGYKKSKYRRIFIQNTLLLAFNKVNPEANYEANMLYLPNGQVTTYTGPPEPELVDMGDAPEYIAVMSFEPPKRSVEVIFENMDTTHCLRKHAGSNSIMLNLANSIQPGGGYVNGQLPQEECLCRATDLYPFLLNAERQGMYPLRSAGHSSAIVSRGVTIFRRAEGMARGRVTSKTGYLTLLDDEEKVMCDVISVAGVNYKETGIQLVNDSFPPEVVQSIYNDVKLIIEACKNHDVIVLGALGCGVFLSGVNEDFANKFRECMCKMFLYLINTPEYKDYQDKKVIFSVLDVTTNQSDASHNIFNRIISEYNEGSQYEINKDTLVNIVLSIYGGREGGIYDNVSGYIDECIRELSQRKGINKVELSRIVAEKLVVQVEQVTELVKHPDYESMVANGLNLVEVIYDGSYADQTMAASQRAERLAERGQPEMTQSEMTQAEEMSGFVTDDGSDPYDSDSSGDFGTPLGTPDRRVGSPDSPSRE